MFVGQSLTEYFFSVGGGIFFALVFVLLLFPAEAIWLAGRIKALFSWAWRNLHTSDDDEGQCPL